MLGMLGVNALILWSRQQLQSQWVYFLFFYFLVSDNGFIFYFYFLFFCFPGGGIVEYKVGILS